MLPIKDGVSFDICCAHVSIDGIFANRCVEIDLSSRVRCVFKKHSYGKHRDFLKIFKSLCKFLRRASAASVTSE